MLERKTRECFPMTIRSQIIFSGLFSIQPVIFFLDENERKIFNYLSNSTNNCPLHGKRKKEVILSIFSLEKFDNFIFISINMNNNS